MFESLPVFASKMMGNMIPEPPTRADVALDEQREIMKSKQHSKTPSILMEMEQAFLCVKLILLTG